MNNKWLALFIVSIGIFMSTLDGSIVNIANPTIAAGFAVNLRAVQWVVTSYLMVITATLLLFGHIGDRVGAHKVYTAGFLLFAAGSWLCSIAPSLVFLIFARVFQGIGASMLMATGMGIVSNCFPPEERGKALGLTGTVVGIGNMTGPSLGGLLVTSFGWPSIFLINIPIGILGFFLGLKYLPGQPCDTNRKPFDLVGLLIFTLGVVTLLRGLSGFQKITPVVLVVSLLSLLGFYLFERQKKDAFLDLALLRIRTVLYGSILAACAYMSQTFITFLMPFYLEKVLHLLPSQSGLFMTLVPASMAVTAPLAGSLSDRIGPSRLISVAFLLMTSGFLVLSTLSGGGEVICIVVGLVLLGVGTGSFGSPNTSSIFGASPREKAGYIGGLIATIRNLFYAMGIATSVGLFTLLMGMKTGQSLPYPNAFTSSLAVVFRTAAGVTVAGFVLSFKVREYPCRQGGTPEGRHGK